MRATDLAEKIEDWLFAVACMIDPVYADNRESFVSVRKDYDIPYWLLSCNGGSSGFIKVFALPEGDIEIITQLRSGSECYVEVPASVLDEVNNLPCPFFKD